MPTRVRLSLAVSTAAFSSSFNTAAEWHIPPSAEGRETRKYFPCSMPGFTFKKVARVSIGMDSPADRIAPFGN